MGTNGRWIQGKDMSFLLPIVVKICHAPLPCDESTM